MIKVCFFASLREQLQCAELVLDDFSGSSVDELLQHLKNHNPDWSDALSQPKLLSAINHSMVARTATIKENDEVAFFPMVTGG